MNRIKGTNSVERNIGTEKVIVNVITKKVHKTKLQLITITRRVSDTSQLPVRRWKEEKRATNSYKLVFKGYDCGNSLTPVLLRCLIDKNRV